MSTTLWCNTTVNLSKKDAMMICSEALKRGIIKKKENIIQGFKTSDIFPLSFPTIQSRWNLYRSGGIKNDMQLVMWLKCKEV